MKRRAFINKSVLGTVAMHIPLSVLASKSKNINIIGVGGAGGNILRHIKKENKIDANYYFINSESKGNFTDLNSEIIVLKIPEGEYTLSKKIILNNISFDESINIFISGLGGVTGSITSLNIMSKLVSFKKEIIWFASSPFRCEGTQRHLKAMILIDKANKLGIPVYNIDNEMLKQINLLGKCTISKAFGFVDEYFNAEIQNYIRIKLSRT